MSISVVCNLSDGLILGVDSAVTLTMSGEITKVFEDAEKIFRLDGSRVGVAFYGMADIQERSIGSFVREFETGEGYRSRLKSAPIGEITESLRDFFFRAYVAYYETVFGMPFGEIDDGSKLTLGLIVGGFSPNAFLSECWHILIPWNAEANSARQIFKPGEFGASWFASSEPIMRYMNGYDPEVTHSMKMKVAEILGRALTSDEEKGIVDTMLSKRYLVSFSGMPIRVGVEWVRFLLQLAIGHYRFTTPHPVVGGSPRIGVVTYRQDGFDIHG